MKNPDANPLLDYDVEFPIYFTEEDYRTDEHEQPKEQPKGYPNYIINEDNLHFEFPF